MCSSHYWFLFYTNIVYIDSPLQTITSLHHSTIKWSKTKKNRNFPVKSVFNSSNYALFEYKHYLHLVHSNFQKSTHYIRQLILMFWQPAIAGFCESKLKTSSYAGVFCFFLDFNRGPGAVYASPSEAIHMLDEPSYELLT